MQFLEYSLFYESKMDYSERSSFSQPENGMMLSGMNFHEGNYHKLKQRFSPEHSYIDNQ